MPVAPYSSKIIHNARHFAGCHRPKHHTYSCATIGLCINLFNTAGITAAAVVKVLEVLRDFTSGLDSIPCANSIRDWHQKWALSELVKPGAILHGPSKSTEWAMLCDISISIGGQRIFLVLGRELTSATTHRALRFEDVSVLAIGVQQQQSWNTQRIKSFLLERVVNKYTIRYAVTDKGPCIAKAMKDLGIERVDDIGHACARHLKKQHDQTANYEALIKGCTHFSRYNTLTEGCRVKPPKLRGTARFMSVAELAYHCVQLINWRKAPLGTLFNGVVCHEGMRAKLDWLVPLEKYVIHLNYTCRAIRRVESVLKHHGVSQQTQAWVYRKLVCDPEMTQLGDATKAMLTDYVNEQYEISKRLKIDRVLCSTDIVESCFGTFKYRVPKQPGLRSAFLNIATYGRRLIDPKRIAKAMETHTTRQVKEHISEQLIMKRNVA